MVDLRRLIEATYGASIEDPAAHAVNSDEQA